MWDTVSNWRHHGLTVVQNPSLTCPRLTCRLTSGRRLCLKEDLYCSYEWSTFDVLTEQVRKHMLEIWYII